MSNLNRWGYNEIKQATYHIHREEAYNEVVEIECKLGYTEIGNFKGKWKGKGYYIVTPKYARKLSKEDVSLLIGMLEDTITFLGD